MSERRQGQELQVVTVELRDMIANLAIQQEEVTCTDAIAKREFERLREVKHEIDKTLADYINKPVQITAEWLFKEDTRNGYWWDEEHDRIRKMTLSGVFEGLDIVDTATINNPPVDAPYEKHEICAVIEHSDRFGDVFFVLVPLTAMESPYLQPAATEYIEQLERKYPQV